MSPLEIHDAQVEVFGKATQYQSQQGSHNYQVLEQRFLVTANKAGTLAIPPVHISGIINTANPNDFFGFATSQRFNIASKAQSLQVRSIPNNIAITEWLPAKQLSIHESWSETSSAIKIGQVITRTINLVATGLTATKIPELSFKTPDGVNAYPDHTEMSTNSNKGGLVSSKTFKIAYIPNQSGNITFPEQTIKWWDINSDKLKTIVLPAKSYTVTVADSSNPNSTANPSLNSTPSALNRQAPQQNPRSANLWIYLTIICASLWLLTIIIAVIFYYRKRLSPNQALSPVKVAETKDRQNSSPLNKQINPINRAKSAEDASYHQGLSIKEACAKQNIFALNLALLAWANTHFSHKFYTISEIQEQDGISSNLSRLIDAINAALYRNQEFHDYNELETEILALNKKKPKFKNSLPQLYPD